MIQGEQDASQLFGKISSVFTRSCCPLFLFKCLTSTSEKPRNFIQNIKICIPCSNEVWSCRRNEMNGVQNVYTIPERIDDYALLVL